MEQKSLLQQQVAGYQVTLFTDGRVSIHKGETLMGQGSLDSVVLTQWQEAHVDGCNARLGKSAEETEEIYDQIDDALSLALSEDEALSSQLFLHRSAKQLTMIAESWVEQLSPTEKNDLLQNKADPPSTSSGHRLQQKIRKAEFLSLEQAQAVTAKLEVLVRGL